MGFLSKVFKPVQKIVQKIVPKEIRPALPFIASAVFGPATAGLTGTSLAKALAQRGLISGLTRYATDQDADVKDVLRAGALSVAPQVIGAGIQSAVPVDMFKDIESYEKFMSGVKDYTTADIGKGTDLTGILQAGKALAIPTTIESAAQVAELNEKAIRDYEAQLAQQGVIDKSDRRNAIFGYFSRAGYGDDEINSMLSKYGYASGGRVGYKEAGLVTLKVEDLLEMMSNKNKDKEDKFDSRGLSSGIEGLMSGYKIGTGKSLLSEPEVPRFTPGQFYNQGGAVTPPGMEMDLRGGGFIRIGSKEKADDVNARVSKNEFVMTADAVRGAGRGDPRLGARRMYEIMNKFEAMA
jgi:hypothetical protein